MNLKSFRNGLLGLALCGASATSVAAPILGANIIVANDGNVVATYLGHSAGYSNDLYLYSPTNGLGVIFNNHATPVGTSVDLGFFTAGTELIFSIFVNNTGDTFYSGDASRNADQLAHAVVDTDYAPGQTYVGFEDLWGGGDRDYDDIRYSFTNVRTGVPAPAAALLVATGIIGIAAASRRKTKSA